MGGKKRYWPLKNKETTMADQMFIHDKCGRVKITQLPNDVMERLLLRQDDASPFVYRLKPVSEQYWWVCLVFVLCVQFICSLPAIYSFYLDGIVWSWADYPWQTFFPFLIILGIWINEYIIRDWWTQKRKALKNQLYITPMYLVDVATYTVGFYPLMMIDDIHTTNHYEQNYGGPTKYCGTVSRIEFKDKSSFGISFSNETDSHLMVDKMNEYRNMFGSKLRENDYLWLIYNDDFKSMYERPDFQKRPRCFPLGWIDLVFFIANCILAAAMAIGMKMIWES